MYPTDQIHTWFQGKGHWHAHSDEEWNDWKWQMRNSLKTRDDFKKYIELTEDEDAGFDISKDRLSVSVTPHFFNLIDPNNPSCPVRRQILPHKSEGIFNADEMLDPVGEETHMPIPCVVHRYPDRVLFLATDRCASYCRYCTRSRLVSNAQGYGFHPSADLGIEYIRKNKSIRDVLISGGDPLVLSNEKLGYLLKSISDIEHVEFLRIGSRIPVFMPQRIDSGLLEIFNSIPNLWLSIHVNHPAECTLDLKGACEKLIKTGIPLGNQSVLLKGVNDTIDIQKSLVHRLLMMKVRPYYLYQCDLIKGSAHLRTDPRVGIKIIKGLRGYTTGYAIPQFVIDAPGGGGKIPINPDYASFNENGELVLKNYANQEFIYPTGSNLLNI